MTTIRILPEILSNQIAAGEVVERPVSIVKELVENSIDAGATSITIEIANGGKSVIRVSDDGIGLSRDDALLAIERYATSKIYTTKDLFSISTMGFRGEALPSIASISKMSLVTRTRDADIATRIDMAGGRILNVSDAGAPVGTMVEVKSLFYNTPARKKFLKSDQTEISHVNDAIFGMALGHKDIRFRLFVDQKMVKNFSLSDDLFQRSVQIIGAEASDKLYALDFSDSLVKIYGYCSNPGLTRSTSSKIFLFVNRRLIYDRGLISAIFKGYRSRIMKGRFPAGAFFIDIPFDQVDVNVHPSKREIRFFDGQRVYQALAMAVENTLAHAQQDMRVYSSAPPFQDLAQDLSQNLAQDLSQDQVTYDQKTIDSITDDRVRENPTAPFGFKMAKPGIKMQTDHPSDSHPFGAMNIIGQVLGTYILAESDQGLVMIDQHAAHERIVYERLKHRYESLDVQSQTLVVPETLEFSFKEADLLTRLLPDLLLLGFNIEPFGGSTFVVKAVPAMIDGREIRSILIDIIESALIKKEGGASHAWLDDCLMLMACHTAVRANKTLHPKEMQALVTDLELCKNSRHCPHGRPIVIYWSKAKIEQLFKRVV